MFMVILGFDFRVIVGYLVVVYFFLTLPLRLQLLIFHFNSPRTKQLSERDRIAAMFCGSHKTLAFGIPLIKVCMRITASLQHHVL